MLPVLTVLLAIVALWYAAAAPMIVLDHDETGVQNEQHQERMMGEIAKLTAGSDGTLDPADYERTVASLSLW